MIVDERGAGIKSGLANVTADLVRRKVNIIVADGLPAAQAATKATTAIPIVMVGVADPVRLEGWSPPWRGQAGTSPAWRSPSRIS